MNDKNAHFSFLLCLCSSETSPVDTIEGVALKIATFNVQIFGYRKMANHLVRDILVKVFFIISEKELDCT